jgi:hypothetical protein
MLAAPQVASSHPCLPSIILDAPCLSPTVYSLPLLSRLYYVQASSPSSPTIQPHNCQSFYPFFHRCLMLFPSQQPSLAPPLPLFLLFRSLQAIYRLGRMEPTISRTKPFAAPHLAERIFLRYTTQRKKSRQKEGRNYFGAVAPLHSL